jgi:hypothetical protein
MSIQAFNNYYILITPAGHQIKCHNRATVDYYVRLIKAGGEVK